MKKRGVEVCKIVLITSIAWFLLDTILILYVIDCNSGTKNADPIPDPKQIIREYEESRGIRSPDGDTIVKGGKKAGPHESVPKGSGLLSRLMKGLKFGSGGPGEYGKPVHIEKGLEKEMKEKFKLNQFNIMASDRIAINRTLPDVRMPQCRAKIYPHDLPPASIIIVFHNEAWSTLLRSIHSVINRSPRHLLTEIILIDDLSDRDFLKDPLDAYIKLLPVPTRIVHFKERSGLIRARLTGADMAIGPVLLFLDAHIEVTEGWLEPLLVRIYDDKKRVVAPIIDVISDETFEYVTASDMTWGGFNWHLNFRWYPVPPRELERRNNDRTLPIETPTIAGGLFAIDKKYFYSIGTYDEGMQIWGGENLEISFRVWMCGGKLEIVTCSHVGHIFRKQTPYTFPGGTATVIHHNAARTAEVWMDGWKEFFYKMTPGAKQVAVGDISMRQRLRKKLNCKSFRWYLENIYKEAPTPLDYYSLGSIRSPYENMCLDTMGRTEGQHSGLSKCHGMGGNQNGTLPPTILHAGSWWLVREAWSFTAGGEIRTDETCLAVDGSKAKLEKCHKNQQNQLWTFDADTKQFKHTPTQLCLTAEGEETMMKECEPNNEAQMWILENYQSSMHNAWL